MTNKLWFIKLEQKIYKYFGSNERQGTKHTEMKVKRVLGKEINVKMFWNY